MYEPDRLLHVIRYDIYPLTEQLVASGNNLFGAAVLVGPNLDVVVVGSNRREENPTFHGEMVTIRSFFALKNRPDPAKTIFLSSHEPCSMCLSALAWCGFREIRYLFDYKETAEDFSMPGDLAILKELFGVQETRHENAFLRMVSIRSMAERSQDRDRYIREIEEIKGLYKALRIKGIKW